MIRTIHVIWIGDESKRPDNCIETWRRLNPDWNIRIWGNQELQSTAWYNISHIRQMLAMELNGVADIMRWEILYKHGGFAIDADSICVRPLADWLFEPELFASWENELVRPGLITCSFVYSHPENSLIHQVIQDIHNLPDMNGGRAWQLVGPQRITDTIRAMAYTGITIYPSHYFTPEHFAGIRYTGNGPIFARQLWGSTLLLYDTLSSESNDP